MSHRTLVQVHPLLTARAIAEACSSHDDGIERLQLARLASAILSKSDEDLNELTSACPDLAWEWIDEFRRRKARADAESRMWSLAMMRLAKTLPDEFPAAAE